MFWAFPKTYLHVSCPMSNTVSILGRDEVLRGLHMGPVQGPLQSLNPWQWKERVKQLEWLWWLWLLREPQWYSQRALPLREGWKKWLGRVKCKEGKLGRHITHFEGMRELIKGMERGLPLFCYRSSYLCIEIPHTGPIQLVIVKKLQFACLLSG